MTIWLDLRRVFDHPVVSAIIGGGLVSVLVPTLGYWSKDREMDITMVNISLQILSAEATKTSEPGRKFALRSLERYSGVDIPDEDFEIWAREGTIPDIALKNISSIVGRHILYGDNFPSHKAMPPPVQPPPCVNTVEGCVPVDPSIK
jgi:hypothetical protein